VSAQAQVSPEQIDQLMREIRDGMRETEQLLARASRPATSIDNLIEDLLSVAEGESVPSILREFLMNNPDLLAELLEPEANEERLLELEDDIRRLFYTEDNGVEQFLTEHPEVLEQLVTDEELLNKILQSFLSTENDLEDLFQDTEQSMTQTESDLERLIELVEEAGDSMQQQSQQQGQGQDQEDLQQENSTEGTEEGSDSQTDEYNPSSSESGSSGSQGEEDPDAWIADLPEEMQEAARDATQSRHPEGYERELAEFYKALARMARQVRERQEQGN